MDYYNNFIDHCDAYSMWNKNTEKQESVKTKTQEETKENTEEKKTTEEYVAGTSQDDATLIPEGKKITGKLKSYEEGWYSFKTGNDAGTSYSISFWFRQCKENYGAICMMNQERR